MNNLFERYELLSKDVKHQIYFVSDYYAMDFEHLQQILDEMKEIQKTLKQNQSMNEINDFVRNPKHIELNNIEYDYPPYFERLKENMFNNYGFELTDEQVITYSESKNRLYPFGTNEYDKFYEEFANYLSNYITGMLFPNKNDSQDVKDLFYKNMIEKAKEKGYMWIYDQYVDNTYFKKYYNVKFKITSLVEGRNYFGAVELNKIYEGILNSHSVKFTTKDHNGSFSDNLQLYFFKYYNCQIVEYIGECSRDDFGD